MPEFSQRGRVTRRLRFRITAFYLVFFTLVLAVVGLGFRQIVAHSQDQQNRLLLEEQWGALRGYLRFPSSGPHWLYSADRPEQASMVARLRHVFFLADAEGRVLEISPNYEMLGPDSAESIRKAIQSGGAIWRVRKDSRGAPYLIRAGTLSARRGNRRYYAAIGRSMMVNQAVLSRFTWTYFSLLPIIVLTGGFVGWFLTSRALYPLNTLATTSQRISGSNLSLRIPLRGAGDEIDHLTETFNQMMDRLEDSFRHIKQFSTDVSHELRTPITGARGQLEVALLTAQTVEQYQDAIENALEDIERLSRLVNAMLLLSQAESGQMALQKERFDLGVLLREFLDEFAFAAEQAEIRLVSDLPRGLLADVDRVQFDRLVSNLLSNAIKFTAAGGEVRVLLREEKGAVKLLIEDTGRGIPPEEQSRIFDRFYRVRRLESVMEPGLGLGLSFVAWIVKAHGGTIEVQSDVGKGSRFIVTLPAAAEAPPPTQKLTPQLAKGD